MKAIKNEQHLLAEQFLLEDIQVIKANYEASLKIKRWKFIQSLPILSTRIKKEADYMIEESFLSFIDNTDLLITEGFYTGILFN
jgi:hypothetical protein